MLHGQVQTRETLTNFPRVVSPKTFRSRGKFAFKSRPASLKNEVRHRISTEHKRVLFINCERPSQELAPRSSMPTDARRSAASLPSPC